MANNNDLEKRLWEAADQLWANSSLRPSEYSGPVLGLIFLRYADHRFTEAQKEFTDKPSSGRRQVGPTDYHARGILYIPEQARFSTLKSLPESQDLGKTINDAMAAIEEANPYLRGTLPHTISGLMTPPWWRS